MIGRWLFGLWGRLPRRLFDVDGRPNLERYYVGQLNKGFNLVAHLYRQREFSLKTFGPGARTAGVIQHIRKELREIESQPDDVSEWIDVVMLALDGAWRAGHEPEAIAAALNEKLIKNENREWPDWRDFGDEAIEHVRHEDAAS